MTAMLGSAIPFHRETSTELESIVLALGVTAVVLFAFFAAAWFGRRRGWWGRWAIVATKAEDDAALVVEQVVRVSRETRVFVLRCGDQRWLLSESCRATSWSRVGPSACVEAPPESTP